MINIQSLELCPNECSDPSFVQYVSKFTLKNVIKVYCFKTGKNVNPIYVLNLTAFTTKRNTL